MIKHLQVAVAILQNTEGKVLITQRGSQRLQGGLWEFPGGKIESHETPIEALNREIAEELGLKIQRIQYFTELTHEYPDYQVTLWAYRVNEFAGIPRCCEDQQALKWVTIEELASYPLLEGSKRLVPLINQSSFLAVGS